MCNGNRELPPPRFPNSETPHASERRSHKLDWTPTPTAHAYRDLVYSKWWTNWKGEADPSGRCEVPAFYGRHRVVVGTQQKTVELKSVGGAIRLSF